MLNQIEAGFGDAINMVITFIPRLIAFLAVLLIGYLVAKAIEKAMDAILERVGFDRLVERGGVKRVLARSRYDASSLLSRIVFYFVMLFVLQLSFGVWGPNPVTSMLDRVIAYLPNIFAAGIIVVVGMAIAAAVADIISAATGGLSYGKALATAASVAVMVVAGFAALDQLNIAPAIVTGMFYAILATVVGVIVVALGGAGIQPLREYWQRALMRVDAEAPRMAAATQGAGEAVKARAQERRTQAQELKQEARGGQGGQPQGGTGQQGGQPPQPQTQPPRPGMRQDLPTRTGPGR